MHARRHFFRLPSPERRQATITAPIYSRLSFRDSQPDPRPTTIEFRRPEPAGGRHLVGGVNETVVIEMFKVYYKDFIDQLHIVSDDNDNEINRRYKYSKNTVILVGKSA